MIDVWLTYLMNIFIGMQYASISSDGDLVINSTTSSNSSNFPILTDNRDWTEILQYAVSKGCVLWFLETIVIKIVFALFSVNSPFLDLLWVWGYKFTSLVFCLVIYVFFASIGYYIAILLTGIAMAVFVIKTLKRYTHFSNADEFGQHHATSKAISTILYTIGAVQIPLLLLIGYS